MLEETFLPTHLRLRKDFNYSYTNLLIIHKARHLSTLSPFNKNFRHFSGIYCAWVLQMLSVKTFAEFSHHFLQGLLWLIRNFFPSNKFQVWEKAILEKGNYIWFQIQYKQRKTMYMQSSISIWLVHVWLTFVISKSFLL